MEPSGPGGSDGSGELGNGITVTSISNPIVVPNLAGVVAIAAGDSCSFAILTNGAVYTWGSNHLGQTGLNTSSGNTLTPTLIPGLSNVCQIASANAETSALDQNETLWDWGLLLGTTETNKPEVVDTGVSFLGEFGKKHYNTSNLLLDSFFGNDGMVADFGEMDEGSGLTTEFSGFLSTNLDWGYNNPSVSSPVATNALYRGSSLVADLASSVIPLDLQKGVLLTNVGGLATNLLPFVTNYPSGYQFNTANSAANSQTNLALRIQYQNPIAAFGSRVGGSSLYTQRSYRFAIFGGCPAMINDYPMLTNYDSALEIEVYSKANYALIGTTNLPIPFYLATNGSWNVFLTNGLTVTYNYYGLATTLSTLSYPNAYGVTNNGALQLSQFASDSATNYIYVVKYKGMYGNGWMSLDQNLNPAWQPLYTLEFLPSPPWNIRFLSQIQFQSQPLPPFYYGKSLGELMTNACTVTNVENPLLAVSTYTNVDDSPELREHPILDQFVSQLKNDPMAIASFVQNQIELTDAIDYLTNEEITVGQLNLGGVNRSALGTFLERQGSPVEQCALLVYMLRQAGVPALFAFPPTNGIKMLDLRLSDMLRAQLYQATNPYNNTINTNQLISLNYPWVAAYINNQWVHLFPWIKDTEIIEGPNLYDFMPTNYNNAMKWGMQYLNDDTNILSLGDTNDPPEILFPRFVQEQLLANAPGISFDQLGAQAVNRQHVYANWSQFPTPFSVAGTNLLAESLSDPVVTNSSFSVWNPYIFPQNHIFDTVDVQVINNGSTNFDTSSLRCCNVEDRPFLIYFERTNITSNTGLRLKMYLASYRPAITNTASFTNDTSLLNKQVQSLVITDKSFSNNITVSVNLTRYSPSGSVNIPRTMPIALGDLNALNLNFGRVSQQMLQPLAQTVWDMQQTIQENTNITSTLTVDMFQGPLIYLMGMSYYQKVDHFIPINAQVHYRSPVSDLAIGLAKLICKPGSSPGTLPTGAIVYYQPAVDMLYSQLGVAEAPTANPESGEELNLANDSFNILTILDGSAKEHVTINKFFNQSDAISTVKLLQLAALRHQQNASKYTGIVAVNEDNVQWLQTNNWGFSSFGAPAYGKIDPIIWSRIYSAVSMSPESQALITPGCITNDTDSYLGMGALLIDNYNGAYAALISQDGNGGWGPYIPDDSFLDDNLDNISLDTDGDGNYSVDFFQPSSSYEPLAFDNFDPTQTLNIFSDANFLQYSPSDTTWAIQSANYLGGGYNNSFNLNANFATDLITSQNQGFLGFLSDAMSQIWSGIKDPVHVVTGEFYVDAVDLTLVGPLPLEVRRNYSSLNLANNEFGIGWKMAFTPFMSVATNTPEMYEAEPDGSVLAFVPTSTNANLWIPPFAKNPQLVNNRKQGVGSTANLFLTTIVETNQSGITNFYLYSPNGDVRTYQVESFSISNVISRTRPYLTSWRDSRGNSLMFSYGTNWQNADYGQLSRVDSSSGAYIQCSYDTDGHILSILSNDGREVDYQYDDLGDLVTVTLPDASQINYQYAHGYQSVTNKYTANKKSYKIITKQPYSLHLLTTKTDPDGNILENTYDSQRRVVVQVASAGTAGALVTNAIFNYTNNFVLTNSVTNTVSGTTYVADAFGYVTVYNYTNSRITLITDPLQQTVVQNWYDDNSTNLPGYSPRSLYQTKDKRGLWTTFQYDNFGNITNSVLSGNLTGAGGTQTATNITLYNTNNLPVITVDALGNSNVFRYDPVYYFQPKEIVAYRQGQAITTNEIFYGSASNVVTYGNTLWTNVSMGLPLSLVRAYSSTDAATNQWAYTGSGFVTNEIDYTSTSDPAITNLLFYNGRGELYQLTDAAGRNYTCDYDGLGRVISEEAFDSGQSVGMFWQNFYYNHSGEITWFDGPQYNPEDYVWYDYDGAGRKVSEVHWRSQAAPDGSGIQAPSDNTLYSITTYNYDPFGNLIEQIDPVGNYSVMAYDKIGQMTSQVFYDASNNALATNLMSREPGGNVANFTNSLGGITQTLYTQTGKPYFRQNADGSTNGWLYDTVGRVLKENEPNGSYWQTTYYDANRTIVRQFYNSIGSLLAVTTNVFDRRGNLITNVTPQGGVFFYVYDGQNRLKVAGGPAAGGASAQQIDYTYYDGAGVFVTNIDLVGRKTITKSDAIGRPISVQTYDMNDSGALDSSQTFSYSPDGHAITSTIGTGFNAISKTVISDSYNNPVLTQTYPGSSTTNYSITIYDLAERVATNQDELGRITSLAYDGLGRVSTKILPDGATIANTYNGEGGLISMAMPGGLTWSGTYNSANQRIGEQLNSGASISRQFTNLFNSTGPNIGLLQSTIDLGRLVTNTFAYDAFRRTTTVTATGHQTWQALTTTYQYDNGGLTTNYTQTSGINPTTSVSRSFDGYGQMINEQVAIGGTVQNSFAQNWDAGGRRSTLQSPTAAFNYGYRADGLMTSVLAFGSAYNFSYNDSGVLISRLNSGRTLAVDSLDGRGRVLQQITVVGSGSPLIENLTWRPDSTLNSYAATRTGTESWNDSRTYQYNVRGQLTSEPIGVNSSTSATNTYSFDSSLLGVLVGTQWHGGLTNSWQASLDAFSQVHTESWNEASLTLRASGSAWNAGSASASLDGSAVSTGLGSGRWYSDLTLAPGNHSLSASAFYTAGQFSMAATNKFSVLGTNNVTDAYDASGNVTNRVFVSGKTQALGWDAAGRLVSLTQWNNSTNGFFWSAIYDALGRRLRTTYLPVINGQTNTAGTLTLDSFFDPQVEFEEVGVAVNGQRTWKVMGPDLDGQYGSLQGVGGLEATVRESGGVTTPVLNDYFGNVLATVSGTATSWSPVRVGGYGPVLGYQSPTLTPSTLLADTLAWRSRGIDPSGFYCLGARYYDPVAGHFLSPDPLGHAASMDLHSFCGGDPINRFDPTGEIGKSIESFGESVEAQMPGEIARFNENLRQADMNYEGTVQQGVIAVGEVALTFALPEVGAALFEEGFGAEAGAGVMFEEEELGAGASSALKTEGSVGGNVESEFGAMEDMKAPTPAASKGLLEEQKEEELVESAPALANDVSEAEQTESRFAEGAKAETADSSGISQSKGANPSSDTPNASPEAAPSQTSGTQAAESATQLEFQFAPQVEQYALRAADSGFYPVMVRGSENPQFITYLEKGDVWKFGTTANPATRYSGSYLQSIGEHGVEYSPEFLGTEQQAVQLQNMKIQNFLQQTGKLPPGNKIIN